MLSSLLFLDPSFLISLSLPSLFSVYMYERERKERRESEKKSKSACVGEEKLVFYNSTFY